MKYAILETGSPGHDRMWPQLFQERAAAQRLAEALTGQLAGRIAHFTRCPTFHVVGLVAPAEGK